LAPKVSDEELLELVEMEVRDLLLKYEYGGDETPSIEELPLGREGDFDVDDPGTEDREDGEDGVEAASDAEEGEEYPDYEAYESSEEAYEEVGTEGDGGGSADRVGAGSGSVGGEGWRPPRRERNRRRPRRTEPPEPVEILDWKHLYRDPAEGAPTSAGVVVDKAMLSRYTLAQKIRPERFEIVREALDAPLRQGADPEPPRITDSVAPPEAWMRSSQRVLERHLAQLGSETLADTVRGRAKQKGAADALRFVANLLGESEE
jgi:hypothetical protein